MDSAHAALPCRILVIDDDPVSLAIAAVLLDAEGFAVLQAESGEQALDVLAASEPPACILADLRMPTLCGPELARQLRACVPNVRVLAMSATPPPAVDGYDGVLEKPLTPEGLRAALDRIAEHIATTPAPADPALVLDDAVFDRLRRAMSRDALEEVIDAFLQDTASRVVNMRTADAATVRRQAHTVKGGAAMLGAVQVSTVASILEEGVDQPGEQLRKLDELELSLRETEVILKQRLKI
jgi:CheY-like chemotaxis protein/HPt (histidine-containing phosphotransfer) domain-containing protein